jgi:hypothetical protein
MTRKLGRAGMLALVLLALDLVAGGALTSIMPAGHGSFTPIDPATSLDAVPASGSGIDLSGISTPSLPPPAAAPLATVDRLSVAGDTPTAIGLTWTDAYGVCRTSFLQYRTSWIGGASWGTPPAGTWTTTGSAYASGLTPGHATSWKVSYHSEHPVFGRRGWHCNPPVTISTSNVVNVTLPAADARLVSAQPNSTTLQLSWFNPSTYGGLVGFGSYQIMGSSDGTHYQSLSTITNHSVRNYTVGNFSGGWFYVNTTDGCAGCAGVGFSRGASSLSEILTLGPPDLLTAIVLSTRNTVDLGQSVELSCVGNGGIHPVSYRYAWTLGDGSTASGPTVTHAYSWVGREQPVCTATDSTDVNATGFLWLNVLPDPQAGRPMATPARPDVGQFVALTSFVVGGAGGEHFAWSGLPSGCHSVDTPLLVCAMAQAGTFQVQVNITDSNGYSSLSPPLSLEVAPALRLTALTTPNGSLDLGQVLTVSVDVRQGVGPFSYAYSGLPPGCATGDQPALSCMPTVVGTFSVRVSVQDPGGRVQSSTVNVQVLPDPVIASFTAALTSVDLGQPFLLAAVVGGGATPYAYAYRGLPPLCYSDNATVSCFPRSVGPLTLRLTVTDAMGWTVSSSVNVSVVSPLRIPSLTVSPTNVRVGQPLTIATAPDQGQPPYSYRYAGLPPGCTSTNASSIVCVPTGAGQFEVTVTVSDGGGGQALASTRVVVTNPPASGPLVLVRNLDPPELFLVGAVGLAVCVAVAVGLDVRRGRRLHSAGVESPPARRVA